MKVLGSVSSEGGPFLLADALAVRSWRGAAESSTDYTRLCEALDRAGPTWGLTWRLGDCDTVVWEAEGAGTADVLRTSPSSLLLVRGWFDGDWEAATLAAANVQRGKEDLLGEIEIRCGVLAALWTPEDGTCVTEADVARGSGEPTGDVAISGSSLLVRLSSGRYICHADQVEVGQGSALRCFVERVATGGGRG
jgi:hypothetical protein